MSLAQDPIAPAEPATQPAGLPAAAVVEDTAVAPAQLVPAGPRELQPVHVEPVRKHRLLPVATALALLAGLAIFAARWWIGPELPATTVARRDFIRTVVASGRVASPHRVTVSAQVTGRVVRVPVLEGQKVEPGAVLVVLDDAEQNATLDQALHSLAQAQARVRQLHEVDEPSAEQALVQARANHATAARTLERNTALQAQGFIGGSALDESRRAEQVARTQVRTAEEQLAGTRRGGSVEAGAVEALRAADAAAQAARARLSFTVLRSPVAGTLIARDVEPGDVVQPGKALMVLAPAGETQLVVQVDERNLRLLQVGQPAIAQADAWPDLRFPARVVYVNPGIDAQRGSVEVKLAVPDPPPQLLEDMTVTVDVEVARKADAVVVPADAVREAAGAPPWVLKVVDGRARRQQLTLGLRSGGWAEVVGGLRPGDRVLRGDKAAQLQDGAHVRATVEAP